MAAGLGVRLKGLIRKIRPPLFQIGEPAKKTWDLQSKQIEILSATLDIQQEALRSQLLALEQFESQTKILSDFISAFTESAKVQTSHYRANLTAMHVLANPIRKEIHSFLDNHQLGMIETVQRLKRERISFARYGDGEIRLMFHYYSQLRFQKSNAKMARELKDLFSLDTNVCPSHKVMIGLPDRMRGDTFWNFTWAEFWPDIKGMLQEGAVYGNAHVSRPEIFNMYKEEAVRAWRDVWAGEKICIITGEGSRFDLDDDLFDNVIEHSFVYSKPDNAYVDIDRTTSEVVSKTQKNVLCLVALGPTGTLLVNRLAQLGFWAIDIGHITASYRQVFKGGRRPESLPLRR